MTMSASSQYRYDGSHVHSGGRHPQDSGGGRTDTDYKSCWAGQQAARAVRGGGARDRASRRLRHTLQWLAPPGARQIRSASTTACAAALPTELGGCGGPTASGCSGSVRRHVLIVGATGVVGRAAVEHFTALGDWKITMVSRRPPVYDTDATHVPLWDTELRRAPEVGRPKGRGYLLVSQRTSEEMRPMRVAKSDAAAAAAAVRCGSDLSGRRQ